jgi:heme/copper-type cytochrome/quinol oxidase subunit 2
LPFYLTNSPQNPLINEIKSTFEFIDPIFYNNEYSRDVYYASLSFFKYNVLKSLLSDYSPYLSNSIFDFFFPNEVDSFNNTYNGTNTNKELYKNQYRPMRKGITNMIRLHATGAMALPIEIRLQVLASSKDVIHSWAIPSAGIKIDCVPGYSSHRVMIFLVSGIF